MITPYILMNPAHIKILKSLIAVWAYDLPDRNSSAGLSLLFHSPTALISQFMLVVVLLWSVNSTGSSSEYTLS